MQESAFLTSNISSEPKQPSLKVREALSKPFHAVRARICPFGANHDHFTAKPSSCYVHSTLWVIPPTSPLSVQCTVWCNQQGLLRMYKTIYIIILKSKLHHVLNKETMHQESLSSVSDLSFVLQYGQVVVDTRLTNALYNYNVTWLAACYWTWPLMTT